jgi:acyl carrier protein
VRSEADIRQALRDWVVKTHGKIRPEDVHDDTPLIMRGLISSLQIIDLLLFLEHLRGKPLTIDHLRAGVFRSINTIYEYFFQEAEHDA